MVVFDDKGEVFEVGKDEIMAHRPGFVSKPGVFDQFRLGSEKENLHLFSDFTSWKRFRSIMRSNRWLRFNLKRRLNLCNCDGKEGGKI